MPTVLVRINWCDAGDPCRGFATHQSQKNKESGMSQQSSGSQSQTPMTQQGASRIQAATAKANGGQVAKGSFAARASSAAAHNSGKGGGGKK
jgi:hypothetical protein